MWVKYISSLIDTYARFNGLVKKSLRGKWVQNLYVLMLLKHKLGYSFWYFKLKSCKVWVFFIVITFPYLHPLDFSFFPKMWIRVNVYVIRLKNSKLSLLLILRHHKLVQCNFLRFTLHFTNTSLWSIADTFQWISGWFLLKITSMRRAP